MHSAGTYLTPKAELPAQWMIGQKVIYVDSPAQLPLCVSSFAIYSNSCAFPESSAPLEPDLAKFYDLHALVDSAPAPLRKSIGLVSAKRCLAINSADQVKSPKWVLSRGAFPAILRRDQRLWNLGPIGQDRLARIEVRILPGDFVAGDFNVPLNFIDLSFLLMERFLGRSLNMHVEVVSTVRMDVERLMSSIELASAAHPLSRSTLRTETSEFSWRVFPRLWSLPIEMHRVINEAELHRERLRLIGSKIDLATGPPFRIALVSCPEHDVLIGSFHHAATDGVGAFSFMEALLEAYAGMSIRTQPDLFEARNQLVQPPRRKLSRDAGTAEPARRMSGQARRLFKSPIAPSVPGKESGGGYGNFGGLVYRRISPPELSAAYEKKPRSVSIANYMLGALHVTYGKWNEAHGLAVGHLKIGTPLDARRFGVRGTTFSNITRGVSTTTTASQRASVQAAALAVADQIRAARVDYEIPKALAWGQQLSAQRLFSKWQFGWALNRFGDIWGDQVMFSNMGTVDRLVNLLPKEAVISATEAEQATVTYGDGRVGQSQADSGIPIRLIAGGPPSTRRSLTVGTYLVNGGAVVTLRFLNDLFDERSAESFADLYLETLSG